MIPSDLLKSAEQQWRRLAALHGEPLRGIEQELVVPDFALGVLQAVHDERKEYRRAGTEHDDLVKGARARISALSARVEQLEEEREAVMNSQSWRLTAPLRRLKKSARPDAGDG